MVKIGGIYSQHHRGNALSFVDRILIIEGYLQTISEDDCTFIVDIYEDGKFKPCGTHLTRREIETYYDLEGKEDKVCILNRLKLVDGD